MEMIVVVIIVMLLSLHPSQRDEEECGNEDRSARMCAAKPRTKQTRCRHECVSGCVKDARRCPSAWSALNQIRRRWGGPVARGRRRAKEPKTGCSNAIVALVVERKAIGTRSLFGRLKATPDRPHSPAQLQPRAVVP